MLIKAVNIIRPPGCAFFSSLPQEVYSRKINKVVNVAIIGAPNVGKSTLINKIIERKVCAASNKVHTTIKMARAMSFHEDTQIVFLDTPGIVSEKEMKKYQLPEAMLKACEKSLRCADVVGVVHDVSNRWLKDKLHQQVLKMLEMTDGIPSFLILNKVDMLKSKSQLLTTIYQLTNGLIAGAPIPGHRQKRKQPEGGGYSKFSDVFLVSALQGDGVADIRNYLISNAKPSGLQYSADTWSDQKPEDLIVEAVRAKFLDFLAQEIPYKLKTYLEYYENDDLEQKVYCSVCVECPSERLMKLIQGAGGGRLQQIKSSVREDLMQLFKKTVVLNIQLTINEKKKD